MRNISDTSCRKSQNTFYVQFFFFRNRAVHEKMWKNIVEPGRPQMAVWRLRIACWIPKATTHSQNMQYILLFHCNNGCMNVPQCYVIPTLPVLLTLTLLWHSERQCSPYSDLLRAGRSGARIPVEARDIFFYITVQTALGAQQTSTAVGTGTSSLEYRERGMLLIIHPLMVERLWISKAMPLLSTCASCVMLYLCCMRWFVSLMLRPICLRCRNPWYLLGRESCLKPEVVLMCWQGQKYLVRQVLEPTDINPITSRPLFEFSASLAF